MFGLKKGGNSQEFSGAAPVEKPAAPQDTDLPLPPVATTGSYLTGILIDENGLAVANTWITFADETRLQTDNHGKFKLPFTDKPQSSYGISISIAGGDVLTGEVQVPSELQQAAIQGTTGSLLLKVQISTAGALEASSAVSSLPVVTSIAPRTALSDFVLTKSELTAGNAAGTSDFDLFTLTKSDNIQESFALIKAEQVCDATTSFDLSQMPKTSDMTSFDMQFLKLCVRLTSTDNVSSFAKSASFSVQFNPYVINDSEGSSARVAWSYPDSSGSTSTIIAISDSAASVDNWNGTAEDNQSGTLTFISDYSNCESSYRTDSAGSLSKSGKCGIDLSNLPAWTKRHFRVAMQKTDGSLFTSKRFSAGRVPAGMVLVAKESWPADYTESSNSSLYDGHEIGAGKFGPFDYAIDKYEASLVLDAGKSDCQRLDEYIFGAANNCGRLASHSAGPAYGASTWFAYKQQCENRTSAIPAEFVNAGNVRRSIHLATDLEWFVAGEGTPDKTGAPYCNGNGSSKALLNPGDAKTALCISDFGARDLVGNQFEWTDGYWSLSGTTPGRVTFFGAGSSAISATVPAPNNGANIKTAEKYITNWDPLYAFPSTLGTSASTVFNSDVIIYFMNSLTTGVGSLRGGSYKFDAGRYMLWLNFNAGGGSWGSSMNHVGGRCALVAP